MSDAAPLVPSPCVKICVVHEGTGFCVGCYRSREEIAQWRGADDDLRTEILTRLPARRRAHADPAARPSRRKRGGND